LKLKLFLFSDVLPILWGADVENTDLVSLPKECLSRWVRLLPQFISEQIDLALNQERPFMPPDVTPEMMAKPNEKVQTLDNIEIIYVSE
jgi:hypothetical protein